MSRLGASRGRSRAEGVSDPCDRLRPEAGGTPALQPADLRLIHPGVPLERSLTPAARQARLPDRLAELVQCLLRRPVDLPCPHPSEWTTALFAGGYLRLRSLDGLARLSRSRRLRGSGRAKPPRQAQEVMAERTRSSAGSPRPDVMRLMASHARHVPGRTTPADDRLALGPTGAGRPAPPRCVAAPRVPRGQCFGG